MTRRRPPVSVSHFWIGVVLVSSLVALARGQVAAPTSAPITTDRPMSADALSDVIKHQLGPLFQQTDTPKYLSAVGIIETYFKAPADREKCVAQLQSLALDAAVIGRLVRIRPDWPDLDGGVYYVNEGAGPRAARYFVGVPRSYDRSIAWPLVIKLPTADAFIKEPKPDGTEVSRIYTAWMEQELAAHPDAICVMPLLNLDELWGPSYAGMNNVIQPMLDVAERLNVDPARVYLVGHSMSGHATWNLPLHYPTYFASFEALAGSAKADWQRVRLMNLRNVRPVVWHDGRDDVIPVEMSRELIKILRMLQCEVDYVETKRVGHVPTDAIAQERYAAMRRNVRELYPRRVSLQSTRPETMFNRNDWVQIYQPARTGQEQKLFFTRGAGGSMTLYSNTFSVDASLDNNRITVQASNIASMRFYVNEQMVDFAKPISVTVNKRPRFEAILKPDIGEMMKDQLFLGRGWRYYTAVIDLDLTDAPATRKPASEPASRPSRG